MDSLVSYHNTPSFIDLNEDQPQDDDHLFHNLISLHISPPMTLSYPQQDQPQFFCREERSFQLQASLEVDHKIVSSGGSCNHHHHHDHNHDHDLQSNIDDHHLNHGPIMNFSSSTSSSLNINNNNNNNNTTNNAINNGMVIIRVCSDCNTTKTPLWRSGPRGPKSLCNACGIRQRKARRAMAANGTAVTTADDKKSVATASKIQSKVKKSKIGTNVEGSFGNNPQFKKRSKPGRKKIVCFKDILRISMKKSSAFHHVFPQDEKDAAILLMALSYGLVHG